MPTKPLFDTTKSVLVEEPTTNCGAPLVSPFPLTDRSPQGLVEAMPTLPPLVANHAPPVEDSAVVEAYGKVLADVAVEVMAPVMASVLVAVSAPPKKQVPLVYWLPCIERSDVGEAVPMPTVPATYALPVVVAPPEIVSPPACVPSPMGEEAEARRLPRYVLCARRPSATKLCVPETAMSQTCSMPSYSIATMRSKAMSSS